MGSRHNRSVKLCSCGRSEIFTGTRAYLNGKNSAGDDICAECVLDNIYAQTRTCSMESVF